jgi:hypothetical protein
VSPKAHLLATPPPAPAPPVAPPRLPLERFAGALRVDGRRRVAERAMDDWPRTTRVLPWLIAAFIAMLWLVPFNSITLGASGPIDLRFDRLVLPILVLVWLLSAAVDRQGSPRLRLTSIHAAIGIFVALSFLSVVLDAGYLNQTLELDTAIKKLSLLTAYATFFVMVTSIVRRTEIRAFMAYTLFLAAVCSVGIIWEYRFSYNVFYVWSDKLLPGFFHVQLFDPHGVDEIGRRQTRGPAELGLEAASMLAMALPIALVGVMHASRWRQRILYGLAACLLLAAAISTYRKTAFLAPLAVVATLAFFRRRELLKLAPLAVVLLVAVHALSPGAIGAITDQLGSSRLSSAATVNDRASDYDAVRPDVWSHLALGRGYGSYEQTRYRILDSEVLHRTVETGVLGLAAYIAMIMSAIVAARETIRSRHPRWAPPALAAAAAAAAFLTVSTLFDAMSFPHGPYIFLSFAGFIAVLVKQPEEART